jgi:hypothetical protein
MLLQRKALRKLVKNKSLLDQFSLSYRALEILESISRGATYQSIAKTYGISRQRVQQVYSETLSTILEGMIESLEDGNEIKEGC